MKRFGLISIISILLCFLIQHNAYAENRLSVFVSILPQKYFVQQIGKELVDIEVMVQPGASPATYEPKPLQMTALAKSQIYFSIGVPFEKAWLKKIISSNPNLIVVHTDANVKKIPMISYHHHDSFEHQQTGSYNKRKSDTPKTMDGHTAKSSHDVDHHDHNGMLDPHIWLSPPLVKIQARAVLDALKMVDADHSSIYEKNYRAFIAEIDRLHADIEKVLSNKRESPFMVFHPSWGYFAKTYGLKQIAVEMEGKSPKPAQLAELIQYARKHEIKVVFVQPQFSVQSVEVIAREIGGNVIFIDPLALDWEKNLREVTSVFQAVIK